MRTLDFTRSLKAFDNVVCSYLVSLSYVGSCCVHWIHTSVGLLQIQMLAMK